MKDNMKEDRLFELPGSGSGGGSEDERLRSLLQSWRESDAPASLDARVMASYRRHQVHSPFWRRVLTATIPVPAPVAAVFAVLLLMSTSLAVRALYRSAPGAGGNVLPQVQAGASGLQPQPVSGGEQQGSPTASPVGGIGNDFDRTAAAAPPGRGGPTVAAVPPARGLPVRQGEGRFTISFRSGGETIEVVTGSDYRLNRSPKIFAGAILHPSQERQMP